MASSSHQPGNDRLNFKSSSPYFFKIILQDTIQNGKLGIPRKFVKNYGNDMSSPAMLRVPCGLVWKVELTKCDAKIWLGNGWLEFSNHYSLELGHLLCFRYDGNSTFHVVIFDRSASEIQYTYTSNNHRQSNEILEQTIDESEDDDSLQIPENISPSRKMREKLKLCCNWPHKRTRSTYSASKTDCNGKSGFLAQQVRHNERVKALERASNAFKSENPFFLVIMQPSYVGLGHRKTYRLSIPRNFVEKHLREEHCSVTLCSNSGKTWIATFKQRLMGKNAFLGSGWGTFVRDNNIQVGDVCAFELINSSEISFKVLIYKGQLANCHQPLTLTDVFCPVKQKAPNH
ncbi:hypothetical protein V6N13_111523 [Hibiscus sabdariffa]|uniref:TF-B3 domain-containing protein n=1 Tax=Hibiscus sabdariffa TaxID=183260 RepID=A0ABR2TKZ4_9ROSI